MRHILPKIIAIITRSPRYIPKLRWSDKSHIYNLFRICEQVFGVRWGVRIESSTSWRHNEFGQTEVHRAFFTLEAILVHLESVVREFLKGTRLEYKYIQLPQFQMVGVQNGSQTIKIPGLVFAIAYDAIGAGGASSPATSVTYSHTVTGSNPGIIIMVMIGDVNGGAGTVTGVTYAGSAAAQTQTWGPTGGRKMDMWDKTATATGANNVVVSYGNSVYSDVNSLSYSGVDQTNLEDTSTQSNGASPRTVSITTTADNCWLVGSASDLGTGPATASTGTTSRGTAGAMRIGDSNGAKTPAGSHSMAWTGSGTINALMIAVKPAASASVNSNFFNFM